MFRQRKILTCLDGAEKDAVRPAKRVTAVMALPTCEFSSAATVTAADRTLDGMAGKGEYEVIWSDRSEALQSKLRLSLRLMDEARASYVWEAQLEKTWEAVLSYDSSEIGDQLHSADRLESEWRARRSRVEVGGLRKGLIRSAATLPALKECDGSAYHSRSPFPPTGTSGSSSTLPRRTSKRHMTSSRSATSYSLCSGKHGLPGTHQR